MDFHLRKGNVINRGGVNIRNKTIYEFLLGEGDIDSAADISVYFEGIKENEINGIEELERQKMRYMPYYDALHSQIIHNNPTYSLSSLFETIKYSSAVHVNQALACSDTDSNFNPQTNTPLSAELSKFRIAVSPKKINTVGMHYEHHVTLMQALDFLYAKENRSLEENKRRLISRQVIGYLQISLSAIDRIHFAQSLSVNGILKRTLKYTDASGCFPDATDPNCSSLGFKVAIYGKSSHDDSSVNPDWYPPSIKWIQICREKTEKWMRYMKYDFYSTTSVGCRTPY